MKNTTFLVCKQCADGSTRLEAVDREEWANIVKSNKGLPMEQRRCFILDVIEDGKDIDYMYIEVPLEQYRKWHSEHVISVRNTKLRKEYKHISIDTPAADNSYDLHEMLPCDYRLDEIVHDDLLMLQLRKALKAWSPWKRGKPDVNEILDAYLNGEKHSSTKKLSKKYDLSEQTIRSYKRKFEDFVIKFFSE